jgi:hypothetical protein
MHRAADAHLRGTLYTYHKGTETSEIRFGDADDLGPLDKSTIDARSTFGHGFNFDRHQIMSAARHFRP